MFTNHWLLRLSDDDRGNLAPYLELETLRRGDVLASRAMRIHRLLFIENGLVSLRLPVDERRIFERALVGRNGIVGIAAFHGATSSPERAVVAVEGSAMALDVDQLHRAAEVCPGLWPALHEYTNALDVQTCQLAGCNGRHSADQRLARWIFSATAATGTEKLKVTHADIAHAIGVRRSTVTVSIGDFEREGILTVHRGSVSVQDRALLRHRSCSCVDVVTAFGSLPQRPGGTDEPARASI